MGNEKSYGIAKHIRCCKCINFWKDLKVCIAPPIPIFIGDDESKKKSYCCHFKIEILSNSELFEGVD